MSLVQGLTNWAIYVQHNVVALRGEEARKAYFDNKSLSFTEGYKVLMGGVRLFLCLINEFVVWIFYY